MCDCKNGLGEANYDENEMAVMMRILDKNMLFRTQKTWKQGTKSSISRHEHKSEKVLEKSWYGNTQGP